MIDFYCSEEHFEDHLLPVANRIQDLGYPVSIVRKGDSATPNKFAVVASSGDLRRAVDDRKMVFYMEHGAGQSYKSRHSSYAGGPGREGVCMFLDPGPHVTSANALHYPGVPHVKVGVPKLDRFHANNTLEPHTSSSKPVVCFSFHWDCKVCPETRTGFPYFKTGLLEAAKQQDFEVVGHAHPRIRKQLGEFYTAHGIRFIEKFEDVLAECDVYVCDNSSTIFEFASVGKPVVLLSPPSYRRFVNHGLRFWDCIGLGPDVSNNYQLIPAIRSVMTDTIEAKRERTQIINKVYYSLDGKAAERAADGILEFMEEVKRVEAEGNFLRCKRTAMGMFGLLDPGQTIIVFPNYAIVNDVHGNFQRRVKLSGTVPPAQRIKQLLKKSSRNYELVEPNMELLDEIVTKSDKGKDFVAAERELTEVDLYLIQKVNEGLTKTKAVYNNDGFDQSRKRVSWAKLEEDGIIVPSETPYRWEIAQV